MHIEYENKYVCIMYTFITISQNQNFNELITLKIKSKVEYAC